MLLTEIRIMSVSHNQSVFQPQKDIKQPNSEKSFVDH